MQSVVGYIGASLFASAFFLLVFFAALTSQVSILQVPVSAFQDELKFSRNKSVWSLGACAVLLVVACITSFGMVPFFTEFISYGGGVKSIFDLVIDVFYETILPLNGFVICLFVVYRWKRDKWGDEMAIGDDGYQGSFTQKYVDFALGTFIPVILLGVFINTVLIKFLGINIFG